MLPEQLLQEHAPRAWIIWSNILSPICSRSMIWMHTAPGAYVLYYAPGALCIQNMLMEHIWCMHRSIVHSNMLLEQLVLEHNLGPKSYRSSLNCLFTCSIIVRPVARGRAGDVTHHPKFAKKSPFSQKVDQKWSFCMRGEVQKSTSGVQKVHILGIPHLPNIDPGYRPDRSAAGSQQIIRI